MAGIHPKCHGGSVLVMCGAVAALFLVVGVEGVMTPPPSGQNAKIAIHDRKHDVEVSAQSTVGSMFLEFHSDRHENGRLHCSVRASEEASQSTNGEVEGQKPEGRNADLPMVDLNYASCGKTNFNTRIVGGREAHPHDFPWLVSVYFKSEEQHKCGGTIINERFILTAGHCVVRKKPDDLSIAVAKHKSKNDPTEKIFEVHNFIIHGKYKEYPNRIERDIALIELKKSLRSMIADENGWVRPICLPEKTCRCDNNCYVERSALVTGWGLQNVTKDELAASVQYVDVPILDNDNCKQYYTNGETIDDYMVCAGLDEGGKDSCQGDSGGPLAVFSEANIYTLVGVVSEGIGCAEPKYPGVYTRVSEFLPWIREHSRL